VYIHSQRIVALVDSGASENFISLSVAQTLGAKFHLLKQVFSVKVASGATHEVTHFTRLRAYFGRVCVPLVLRIIEMDPELVLGMPFLRRFEPQISWTEKTISFEHRGRPVALRSSDTSSVCPLSGRRVVLSCLEIAQPSFFVVREKNSGSSPQETSAVTQKTSENVVQMATEPSPFDQDVPDPKLSYSDDSVLGGAKLPPKLELSEVPKEICYLVSLYADIFPPELPPGLPPHRAVDFHIDLVTGAQPPKHRMYRMAPAEDIILKETLEKYLADGKLEPAQSPFGAGVTFAPKKDGGFVFALTIGL